MQSTCAQMMQDVQRGPVEMIDLPPKAWQALFPRLQAKIHDLETHFSTLVRSVTKRLASLYAKAYIVQVDEMDLECYTPYACILPLKLY